MGNACSSGAVNAPIKRGQWPRPPKQPNCLHCGTALLINRRGDPNKKFCNTKCAAVYTAEKKCGPSTARRQAKESCLRCHDALMMKSAMSALMVAESRRFILERRRAADFDSTAIMSRASKAAHAANGTMLDDCKKLQRALSAAWRKEWNGVVECYYARWGQSYLMTGKRRRALWRQKYKVDPAFTAKRMLRNQIARIKRRTAWSKRSNELLGCTYEEARRWIESKFQRGMSWSNCGEWQIDHIIPIAAFDLTDERQVRCVNHYSNLQPLWAKDNMLKRDKILHEHQLALL